MNGTLYNIGVGPGDPELLTLKAVRILKECSVIAIPQKEKSSCVAYQIARQAVSGLDEKECLCLHMPMTKDKEVLEKSHKEAAEQVKQVLKEGRDVALLTLGDATIYATSLYIQERIQKEGFSCCIINGIPSFCAAAARLNMPLVSGAQQLHIIPASYPVSEVEKWSGVKVLMKAGSKLGDWKRTLMEDNTQDVKMVERCGMEGERVFLSAEEIPQDCGYYSLFIVSEKK